MAINKVIFGNTTLMDTTGVTVTPDKMVLGTTALSASGETITGTLGPATQSTDGLMSATDKAKLDDANACATVGPSAVASFSDAIAADALNLSVDIEPVQDLHGYDHPWPAGGGNNKLDYSTASKTSTAVNFNNVLFESGVTYTFTYYGQENIIIISYKHGTSTRLFTTGYLKTYTYTALETEMVDVSFYNSDEITAQEQLFQMEVGNTSTAWSPYENICPISGWTGCNISHSGEDTSDPTVIPISWQSEAGTVYGGTLDVTTGLLTVTYGNIASYASETLPGAWISSMDVYTAGGTPTTGAQVVYELATPQTYQLTPTQIALLEGVNNVWADTGETTVTYLRADSLCINRAIAAWLKDSGDVNVIESISVNGTNIQPDGNKNVNLTVPEDVGFYVDAQGYICQRIGSDT